MPAASGSWRTPADDRQDRVLPLALGGSGALGPSRSVCGRRRVQRRRRASPSRCPPRCWSAGARPRFDRPRLLQLFLPRGRRRLARRGPAADRGRRPPNGLAVIAGGASPTSRRAGRRGRGRQPTSARCSSDRGPSAFSFARRLRAAAGPRAASDRGRGPNRRPRRASRSRPRRVRPSSTRASSPVRAWRALPGPGGRTARAVRALPPALRDQHASGLAPRPAVPGHRPQRRDQHRPRQSRASPRASDADPAAPPRRRPPRGAAAAAGPLITADGSDSLSLDEVSRAADRDRLGPGPAAADHDPRSPARAPRPASPRRLAPAPNAGFLAPWDGPAAIVFADGRRVGALRRSQRAAPAAFAVTRDRLVAVAIGGRRGPARPADTVRRGRLGPGQLLLVDPRPRPDPRGHRGQGPSSSGAADPRRAAPRP